MTRQDAVSDLRLAMALIAQIGVDPEQTVDQLASRLGAERAEVERLIGLIGLSGLPPYTPDVLVEIEVADDRVSLRSGPADALLQPPSLTLSETEALHGALAVLGSQLGPEADAALSSLCEKVDASLASAQAPSGRAVPVEAAAAAEDAETLGALRAAVEEHRTVELAHHSASAEKVVVRRVDPYRLVDHGGIWYLHAHCHAASELRTFRVDRVRAVTTTEDAFEAPGEETLAELSGSPFSATPSMKEAAVRVRGVSAARVAERWPDYVDAEHPDGDEILVRIPYRDERWMVLEMLGYLDDAQPLGPDELVAAYAQTVGALADLYRVEDA